MHSLRDAVRTLRRSPGFSLLVILTLSIGIGANTVVFSIVDGTVLNPFPYPEPDRLVGIGTVYPRLNQELGYWEVLSPAEYRDITEQSQNLDGIVAWDMGNRQIAGDASPTNVFTAFWWGDALSTLRMVPAVGRGFLPEETQRGDRVAIISHRLWESRYGSDPGVVGTAILVNDEPHTLVGVMPPKTLVYGTDLWTPMPVGPEVFPRNRRQFQVMARLRDGVTLTEANTELEGIARRIEAAYGSEFEEYGQWRLVASSWTDINVQLLRPAALLLMVAVGLVLLLVCANLANLLLARALKRRREFAVRTALGAEGSRITALLLSESMILALLGGAVGFGLSVFGLRGLMRVVDIMGLPLPAEPSLNLRVLAFTAVASILTGLIFGLAPALKLSGKHLKGALQADGRGGKGPGRHRLQRVFVGVETAVALALLAGSGLLVNSFLRLQRVDTGFQPESLLTMRLTLPWQDYDMEGIRAFFQDLEGRVEALPMVASANVATQFPPLPFLDSQFAVEGEEYVEGGSLPQAYLSVVSPGYFRTMGMTMIAGRALDERDRDGSPEVAVVNQSAARRFFGGENPVGRRFKIGGPEEDGSWITVVGMVADTRNRGLDVDPQPEIFGSSLQVGGGNQFFLIARTEADPRSVLPAIRGVVTGLDPDQPVYAIRTVQEAYAASVADRQLAMVGLSLFAAFALLLASMGIYAVVAFGVAERTGEIGLRMALGADSRGVRRMIVRQALAPVLVGAVVGLGLAFGIRGFLRSLLFEVSDTDPLTFGAVTAFLLVTALVASYAPARRASRLDPVDALREE